MSGPVATQAKSTTRMPAKGRPGDAAAAGDPTAGAARGAFHSASTCAVCSPSRGAGRGARSGVADSRAQAPGVATSRPTRGSATGTKKPRAASWRSAARSDMSATGAMRSPRSRAAA